MDKVVLVFADEDISSIFMKSDKKSDFLDVLKGKLFPPLGLLYIGAILEREKISVTVLDLLALDYSVEDAVKRIVKEKPKVVGFSVQSANLHKIYQTIKGLREIINVKIILGGPHISYSPQAVDYLGADFGIAGDAEYSFRDLVKAIIGNLSLDGIAGLIKRENSTLICNKQSRIEDLDSLPQPARHLWPHKCFSPLLASNVATILTSRGCVYNCIFCGLPDKGNYRARGIANVVDEFQQLYDAGYRHVELQDDMFTFYRQRTVDICKELLKRKIKMKWTCVTRADYVDYELLKLMKQAGCTHVKFGIECASDKLRNVVIGKNISSDKIIKGIKATKRAGICSVGYFVIGIPTETLEDIKDTIRFAYDLNLDYLDFHLTLIISGSRLFDRALREGKIDEDTWKKVALGDPIPVYISDNLDISQMQQLISKGLIGFYFSPRFLFREIFLRTRDFKNFCNKAKLLCLMIQSLTSKLFSRPSAR